MLGVAAVGLVGVMQGEEEHREKQTTPFGVVTLLVALSFYAIQITVEEKFLAGYNLDPLVVVGTEGFWGCLYYAVVLPIFQTVTPCSAALCNDNYLENTTLALQ